MFNNNFIKNYLNPIETVSTTSVDDLLSNTEEIQQDVDNGSSIFMFLGENEIEETTFKNLFSSASRYNSGSDDEIDCIFRNSDFYSDEE